MSTRQAAAKRRTGGEAPPKPQLVVRPRERLVVSIASMPHRSTMLQRVVESLYDQVDCINIYLNGYRSVPPFTKRAKIRVVRSQKHGDRGDAGKFFWAGELGSCYHLTCDDDLLYPNDYAATMCASIERYGREAIVGVHGIVVARNPRRSYYKERRVYRCTRPLACDVSVNILGTGVAAYHTSTIALNRDMFRRPHMADIWLGIAAKAQRIPMVVISHAGNWLYELPDPKPEMSVFARYRGRDTEQTLVVRGAAPWPSPQAFRGAVAGRLR